MSATSTAFRITLLGVLAAVGCGQSSSPMPPFEYKATAAWSSLSTPNVTSMTIDGQPYASGELYTVDETFPSYDDARASFVPKTVVITTTTDTATFQIDLGACEYVMQTMLDEPLVMESDQFVTDPSRRQPPVPSVEFYVDCGTCAGSNKAVAFCS